MNQKTGTLAAGAKRSFTHTITAEDVRRFVELSGDDNPVHVDPAFAARTPLGRPVAHGMLTAAFVSRLIGKYLPGAGALWLAQTFNFYLPVFVGDTLTIQAEVKQWSESQSMFIIQVSVRNQADRLVLDGEGRVQLMALSPGRSSAEARKAKYGVAVVTGASRGIGAACAKLLAAKGHAVAVNYANDRAGAESVVAEIRRARGQANEFQFDVRDEKAVRLMLRQIAETFGSITALVNNAGRPLQLKAIEECAWVDVQDCLEIYLKSAFCCSQALFEPFKEQRRGSIVNIGTIVMDSRPATKFGPYLVAKEAVWALTKALANEWGPYGIRVNMVSPGMTETALITEIPTKARLLTKAETPLRRLASVEDVAAAVAFLAGDDALHVTGENLRVCGGVVMA